MSWDEFLNQLCSIFTAYALWVFVAGFIRREGHVVYKVIAGVIIIFTVWLLFVMTWQHLPLVTITDLLIFALGITAYFRFPKIFYHQADQV